MRALQAAVKSLTVQLLLQISMPSCLIFHSGMVVMVLVVVLVAVMVVVVVVCSVVVVVVTGHPAGGAFWQHHSCHAGVRVSAVMLSVVAQL